MIKKISQFIKENSLSNCSIAVALSGGADSVALFHLLHSIADQFSLKISIAHINYNMRGEESEAEKAFVRALSERFSVPLFMYDDYSLTLSTKGMEEQARNIRYRFFNDLLSQKRVDWVALGHTQSDQAETLLFRLARGSGVLGASAMMAVRKDGFIRPMLEHSRSEIEGYLRSQGVKWCDDSSNSSLEYKRNMIRHRVMPPLNDVHPSVERNLAQFSSKMQDLNTQLLQLFRDLNSRYLVVEGDTLFFHTSETPPFLSYYLHHLISSKTQVSSFHIERACDIWSSGGAELLPGGYEFRGWRRWAVFQKKSSLPFLPLEQILERSFITLSPSPLFTIVNSNRGVEIPGTLFPLRVGVIDKDSSISLCGGSKSAFELLKKRGWSEWFRKQWPGIYSCDGRLIWIPGVALSSFDDTSDKILLEVRSPMLDVTL